MEKSDPLTPQGLDAAHLGRTEKSKTSFQRLISLT